MKSSLLLVCAVAVLFSPSSSSVCLAAPVGAESTARLTSPAIKEPVRLWSPIQDKNFYLLSLLERTPEVTAAIASNEALKKIAAEHTAKLKSGFNEGTPAETAVATFLWSDAEGIAVAQELRTLCRTNRAVKEMVSGPLRQSGMYERYRSESDEELLANAWHDAMGGINNIVQVYGLGQPPRYPKIDSPSYDVKSDLYGEVTNLIFGTLSDDESAHQLFFQPSLRVALALLDSNGRDEAGRFEPMERGENKAAYQKVKQTSWEKYLYSVILVPGQGPEEEKVRLSPKAKLVLASVARQFRQGKAPFIVVSGGYVHPSQTPFCEAIEMKKSLMADYGVPEDAIFIDPHARHTTTNMRNTVCLLYRYGIPFEKSGLITTTPAQSRAIESPKFQARCLRELGYEAIKVGKRTSPLDIEFAPLLDSLQSDPLAPLDP